MANIQQKNYEVSVLSLNALKKIEQIASETQVAMNNVVLSIDKMTATSSSIQSALNKQNKILEDIRNGIVTGNKEKDTKVYAIGNIPLKKIKNAAGLVGLLGFSIITLSLAYKLAGSISPSDIGKGLLVILSIIPIAKVFSKLMEGGGGFSDFSDLARIKKFLLGLLGMVGSVVVMSFMISRMPVVGPQLLLSALAMSGVIYILGMVFVKLINAWEFSGIINYALNRKNTDEIQTALLKMSAMLIAIALSMRLMPKVNPSQAVGFVIATTALIPLAVAVAGMRFALANIKNLKTKELLKMSIVVSSFALAMIPVGLSAKALSAAGITEKSIATLVKLAVAMVPLVGIISLLTAIINLVRENKVGKNTKMAGVSLLKRDNSRKRNAKTRLLEIRNFAIMSVAVIGALALAGLAIKYAGPAMAAGANAARQIDMIGIAKLGLTLLIGTLIVGSLVAMLRGRGEKGSKSAFSFKGGQSGSSFSKPGKITTKDMIVAALAIPVIALGIVAAAWAFKLLPSEYIAPDVLWTLKAGFALSIFSIPLLIVARSLKGLGAKQLLFMAIAIPIVAFGILATAWIFQGLSGIEYTAPDYMWVLQSGLAVVVFSLTLFLTHKLLSKFKLEDFGNALLGVVVSAVAVVAVGFIFSLLSNIDQFIAPPAMWSISAGLALIAMSFVMKVAGPIFKGLGPQGILYGALGIIVSAIVILAVGWILAGLSPVMEPLKNVAQGFTDMLMMPVNAIIDAFVRFKEEIGIANMIDLAIGVAALGGAWFVFSAAVAGGAGLSSFGAAVGAVFDGFTKLFGGKKTNPIDILSKLANLAPKIKTLSEPLKMVGHSFAKVAGNSKRAVMAFNSLISLHEDIDVDDFKSQASSMKIIGDSYAKISKSSNTMNIKAINATESMFKALSDLAKNNGESAMKVLAEQLMVAVKELSGTVENLESSINKQGDTTTGVTDVLSGAINTVKETLVGVQNNVDKMNAESKEATLNIEPLVEAIQTLELRFERAIKVIDVTEEF